MNIAYSSEGIPDHCLYILTHSPSFKHLRVIDLRGTFRGTLLTLKANPDEFSAPSLEEFYIDTLTSTPREAYDVSFLFSDLLVRMTQLKVLWLRSNKYKLFLLSEDIILLLYKTLYLNNIVFKGDTGQQFLDNLSECRDLSLVDCQFEDSDFVPNLETLQHLTSLSLGSCKNMISAMQNSPHIHHSLRVLKLHEALTIKLIQLASGMKHLEYLKLTECKFEKLTTSR